MIELANNAASSLAVAISATDTEVQILSADAPRFPALEFAGDVFPLRLRDNAGNYEYALCTAREGNRLTVARGREGTTALDFAAGGSVELNVTGETWDRLAESRWTRPRDAARKPLIPARVDAASFTLPGDLTAAFRVNRAVHLLQAAEACGHVASSSFASGVTLVTVAGCVVDAGLALVELGLEVESAPKYGDAANADTLEGSGKAEIVAQAQAGTAANASKLEDRSLAEVVAQAQAGTAANSAALEGKTLAEVIAQAPGLPVGAVVAVASETVPLGYMECNGAAVSRTTYTALFSAIGIIHGSGDGSTTFNLPDYRGRFLRGWDHGAGRDPDVASRTTMATGGNTGDSVGSTQTDVLMSHTHNYNIAPASSSPVTSQVFYGGGARDIYLTRDTSGIIYNTGGKETRPVNAAIMHCIKY